MFDGEPAVGSTRCMVEDRPDRGGDRGGDRWEMAAGELR